MHSTFQSIANENGVNLVLDYEGPTDSPNPEGVGLGDRREFGPFGTGRVKDMVLWGDRNRLLQVVNNLTSNAMKFTPSGGTVKVVVRCVSDSDGNELSRKGSVLSKQNSIGKQSSTKGSMPKVTISKQNSGRNSRTMMSYPTNVSDISETPPSSNLSTANEINPMDRHVTLTNRTSSPPVGAREMMFEWEVVDTGPGMPLHVQEKVFEPFFQGDMALSKRFQGTGLGLSICTQLAKLMGGSMRLKSEEGRGSTFTLRCPLKLLGSRADSSASSTGTGSIRFNSPRNSISGDVGFPEDNRSVRSMSASSRVFDGRDSLNESRMSIPGSPSSKDSPFAGSPSRAPDSKGKSVAEVNTSRSLKVLVAEDNKTNQIVVTRLLKMEKITNVSIAEGL